MRPTKISTHTHTKSESESKHSNRAQLIQISYRLRIYVYVVFDCLLNERERERHVVCAVPWSSHSVLELQKNLHARTPTRNDDAIARASSSPMTSCKDIKCVVVDLPACVCWRLRRFRADTLGGSTEVDDAIKCDPNRMQINVAIYCLAPWRNSSSTIQFIWNRKTKQHNFCRTNESNRFSRIVSDFGRETFASLDVCVCARADVINLWKIETTNCCREWNYKCVSALHWTHTYCIYKATPYVSYTILLGEWHADDVRRRLLCCDFVIAHILANEQRPSKHIICVYCTIVGHICIIYATHALGRANQHTHTLPSTTKDAQNRAWWSLRSPFFRVRAVETDLGAGPVWTSSICCRHIFFAMSITNLLCVHYEH